MDVLYSLTVALSLGIIIGFLSGSKKLIQRPTYTDKQLEKAAKRNKRVADVAKYLTFMILSLGLIWCIYFLVLGAVDASQVDYATGMSQLIVSVLTIVSIAFAFFEFLRKK